MKTSKSIILIPILLLLGACKDQGGKENRQSHRDPVSSSPSKQGPGPVLPEDSTPSPTVNNPSIVDVDKQGERFEALMVIKSKLADKEFRLNDEWMLDIKHLFDHRLKLRKSRENFEFNEINEHLISLRLQVKAFLEEFHQSTDEGMVQKLENFLTITSGNYIEGIKRATDTFFDYCMRDWQNSSEIQETLRLLKNHLGNPFVGCDELESRLHKRDALVLDDGRGLIDLSPIMGFYQLKSLQIYRKLSSTDKRPLNLTPLRYLKNLDFLKIRNEEIKDIALLKDLIALETLDLAQNKIEDLSILEHLPHLYTLNLSHNEISDLSSLQGLRQVKVLDLNNNKIKDLEPLEDLTQLERLYLSQNKLKDITILQNFTNLTVLNLSINQIENLSPLAGLEKLENLSANYNPVKMEIDYCPTESRSSGLNRYCKNLF